MNLEPSDSQPASQEKWLQRIRALRQAGGPPNEFWPACLELYAGLAGEAEAALLAIPTDDVATRWRGIWEWKSQRVPEARLTLLRNALRLAVEAKASAAGVARLAVNGQESHGWLGAAVLDTGAEGAAVVLFLLPARSAAAVDEGLTRVRWVSDLALSYTQKLQSDQVRRDAENLVATLDLVAWLDAERTFASAVMRVCNELAAVHRCERVSLAWRKGPYLRLRAISHMEKFEKRMAVVQRLEAAMEEAADQNLELVYPWPPESTAIVRDHEAYVGAEKIAHLCTLPLRLTREEGGSEWDSTPVGALCFERSEGPFTDQELRRLRLAADQVARRLGVLEELEEWFYRRAWKRFQRKLGGWFGPRHTTAKASAVAGAVLLLWACAWPLSFEVSGPFALRSAQAALISAPFEGFLAESKVEKGDAVTPGQVLARLDQTELALELGAALADSTRFEREAQQARSQEKLAEMQIALARAEQAQARLEILRRKVELSDLKAPFAGVVVEGDVRERIGAPVKPGDALFRVAQLDKMFVEVLVNEADVRFVQAGAEVEVAFASKPGERFTLTVVRVEPLAQSKPEGNVFIVRCALPPRLEAWWRPGMSGVARIDAGWSPPLIQATRRTLDYLRLRW